MTLPMPANDMVRKFFSVETKTINLDLGIFEAMISTEDVDRDGDIVRATGAKIENYLKNPVVLFAHDYGDPPIARALSIEILPGRGLRATFQFPEWGSYEQADVIRRLWAAGFLNATSIGFIPLDWKRVDGQPMAEGEFYWGPKEFTSWELLEFSIVPVPANQSALRLAVKALHQATEAKRGRVLSARNEQRIRNAQAALSEVLESLGEQPEPDDENSVEQIDNAPVGQVKSDDAAEPITGVIGADSADPQEQPCGDDDVSDAELERLAETLSTYFVTFSHALNIKEP